MDYHPADVLCCELINNYSSGLADTYVGRAIFAVHANYRSTS
jgi:hypothetical protein